MGTPAGRLAAPGAGDLGVVFAYCRGRVVGIAAGETANPHKIMPRAINSVVFRIAIFYIGSTVLLALLLPHTAYRDHVSPFVTFFSKVGFGGAGSVMNLVVLTAALSSLNAGLYSTGRILRSMAINGSGPKFTAPMTKNGVPYGGILLTAVVGLSGIVLNAVKPSQAFEIVLHIAAVGVVVAWGRSWRASCGSTGSPAPGRCNGRTSGCRLRPTAATSRWPSWPASSS